MFELDEVRRHLPDLADIMGVPEGMLFSHCRARHISWPRHNLMRVVRELTDASYPFIGKILGGRDHTSAMHGVTQSLARCEACPKRSRQYQEDKAACVQHMLDARRIKKENQDRGRALMRQLFGDKEVQPIEIAERHSPKIKVPPQVVFKDGVVKIEGLYA